MTFDLIPISWFIDDETNFEFCLSPWHNFNSFRYSLLQIFYTEESSLIAKDALVALDHASLGAKAKSG